MRQDCDTGTSVSISASSLSLAGTPAMSPLRSAVTDFWYVIPPHQQVPSLPTFFFSVGSWSAKSAKPGRSQTTKFSIALACAVSTTSVPFSVFFSNILCLDHPALVRRNVRQKSRFGCLLLG